MVNMISKSLLKKTLYFDIETSGITQNLEDLEKENPRLAEIWKKRCKWLAKNSGEEFVNYAPWEFWKIKSSLHPEFAKIVCVSFGAYDESGEIKIQSFTGEEKEILKNSNLVLNRAMSKGWKLAGHTIKNFDIPFMGKRMLINGIEPSSMIASISRKPWDSPFLDIAEIFSFGGWGQTHTSLDLMSSVFGHESPKDEMDGSMVHGHYYEGKIDEIKKYCEMDVKVLMKCFDSFSFDSYE